MRGRRAVSAAEIGVDRLEDPPLLRWLAETYGGEPFVLVTGDDAMPAEHGGLIRELGLTIATVDGRWSTSGLDHEAWKREIVHRWAHAMQAQPDGLVRRYSVHWYRPWTRRRSR